ncbi:MAG: sel1 repeat family protein [Rhodospirillaceae bacterium]|nr:sel1 repeat family protein [Rhodospirillaceae bacterium]
MLVRACAAAVATLIVAGCTSDGELRDDANAALYEPGLGGRGTIIRPGGDPNAIFGAGMDLKAKGDCAGAAVKLRLVANMGPGYENAQTALGECLTNSGAPGSPTADFYEGMTWLRRAADAGWPEAQGRLAQIHALGPSAIRNGEEAGYWMALYDANATKSRLGFTPMEAQTLSTIRDAISAADRVSGEKRAAQWQRKVWLPPVQPKNAQTGGPGARQQRTWYNEP